MGKGAGSTAWVNQQTSIIGREQVDIRVEGNTHVEGAVIAAENGNLKLDTDTLTYKDIYDHDKAENQQASLSGSISAENEKNNERTTGEDGNPYAGTAEGSYSSHDRQQITRATIGEGEIIIRSDPAAGLEGLNRDLEKAQEITKDEKTSVTVYIDSAAIAEVASGGAGIVEGFENTGKKIQQLANEFQAITASLPPEMKHLGDAGLTAMQSMIRANVPDDAIAEVMNDEQFQKILTKAADLTEYLRNNSDIGTDLSTRSLSKTPENGDVIAIYGPRKTLGTQLLDLLIETQRFIDGIPYKEEAQIALIGLQVALGGPVKTAVSVVNNVVLDSLVGDKIEQLSTAVATEIAAILGYGKDSTQITDPPRQEDIEAAKLGLSLAIGSIGTVVAGKAVIADMTKSVAAFRKIGIEEVVEFDAKTIRFTQDSISNEFKGGKGSLKGLIDDLKSGKVSSDDIPPIRVFEKDGKIYSLDNRRLKAFQEANVPIRIQKATQDEVANEMWKFHPIGDGLTINVRGGGL
jgi:filamentous hemagglutinin